MQMQKLVLGLLLAALLGGCATDQVAQQKPVVVEDRTATTKTQPPVDTRPLTPPVTTLSPLKDPNNILSKRSVFFDYDSYDVKGEYQAMIEAHGKYLNANPNARIFLQGNCDDRGSPEYNLALGQKRAEAVRKMLSVMGVKEEQMESVSFGKEKPRAICPEESCLSQNRRADVVYQGE
jgi:peptidoglycan-associated lipoprotein